MTAGALAGGDGAVTAAREPLGPGSLAWRLGLPRTALMLAGRALLMQVSHPVVGAGVHDFSTFRADPWGRLARTIGSLDVQLFGGEQLRTEAARLRELHKTINGAGFDGRRYSALNPKAYAWVHLTVFDATLVLRELFGPPLTASEQERFYREWRQVGLVLGIRDRDMPPGLGGFHAYVDEMVASTLDDNPSVHDLLDSLTLRSVPPPASWFPRPVWAALRPAGRTLLRDMTVGTLPGALRGRLGLTWSTADDQRLRWEVSIVRTVVPLLPDRAMHYPLAYAARQAAKNHSAQTAAG